MSLALHRAHPAAVRGAVRAASSRSTSFSRSAKRSIGTPLWRAPRNSPGPRNRKILARNLEAVGVLVDDLETLARKHGQRLLIQQNARLLPPPRPTRPRNWCKLRKSHALGVLDDHQRGIRHIDADLDHGSRDEQLDVAALKASITAAFSAVGKPAVHAGRLSHRERSSPSAHRVSSAVCSCRASDSSINGHTQYAWLPGDTRIAHALDHFIATRVGHQPCGHRRPARRHFVDHRDVEIGVVSSSPACVESASHSSSTDAAARRCRVGAFQRSARRWRRRSDAAHRRLASAELAEFDFVLKQRMRADRELRVAGRDLRSSAARLLLCATGCPASQPLDAERLQAKPKI